MSEFYSLEENLEVYRPKEVICYFWSWKITIMLWPSREWLFSLFWAWWRSCSQTMSCWKTYRLSPRCTSCSCRGASWTWATNAESSISRATPLECLSPELGDNTKFLLRNKNYLKLGIIFLDLSLSLPKLGSRCWRSQKQLTPPAGLKTILSLMGYATNSAFSSVQ